MSKKPSGQKAAAATATPSVGDPIGTTTFDNLRGTPANDQPLPDERPAGTTRARIIDASHDPVVLEINGAKSRHSVGVAYDFSEAQLHALANANIKIEEV